MTGRQKPTWMVLENPIFRRYCRSRLRLVGMGVWVLLALIIAGFIFFMSRQIALYRADASLVDGARAALLPLLVFQGVVVFLLGTGQMAGGMTAEADEGVLDYQRLAPMSPLAKVLGFLFGLPVREWVMFFATVPFTIYSLWRGEVPAQVWCSLYGVFISSALLYHLTGLVAGTVMKNRRWAFLVSIGVIFCLYTIVPQVAKFGLVYFKYLTIRPVLDEVLPFLLPQDIGALAETAQKLMPQAKFFGIGLPEAVFTVFAQGVLILTFLVMLWRRWRRAESHLMGKGWAVGFFVWIQVMLLGNALPLIEPGLLFPSREMSRRFGRFIDRADWEPQPWEAMAMVSTFGLVTLLVMWVVTAMITPSAEGQKLGWRRVRKRGRASIPLLSDPATATWAVGLMAVVGASGWYWFTDALIGSRWFLGQEIDPLAPWIFLIVFLVCGFGFQALLEWKGGKKLGLAVIFIGVVPVMVGSVVAATDDRLLSVAMWFMGISPVSAPVFAGMAVMPSGELPLEIVRSVPRALLFWQGVGFLVALRLLAGLRRSRREISEKLKS